MSIVLEYKLLDTTKTKNHVKNFKQLNRQIGGEFYDASNLLDDVKLNFPYRDAHIIILRNAISNCETLRSSLLALEFQDEICFVQEKLDEIFDLEYKFNNIMNLEKGDFYTSYRKNTSKFRRFTKQPFTIGVSLNNVTLKLAWFAGTIKISSDLLINLNFGDVFILDHVANGSFLGMHGLCVKVAFISCNESL